MGNPKKRHSRWKRDMRRANWRLSLPALVECPQCHEKKLAHVACPHCGWYKGRVAVVAPQKEAE
ncbi:MAG: 50S ribosomal protein L32 [Bacteroidota bacterium]|jgi:large subunit ribosomal protein L32